MTPKAAFTPGQHVAGQHVARSGGYMLTVSRQHNYYSFMSRLTCIPLYPATDGQQTGNNFDADTRNMLPWYKRGLSHVIKTHSSVYAVSSSGFASDLYTQMSSMPKIGSAVQR